jgi:threonine aldolase
MNESERDWREAMWRCERWLDHRRPTSAATVLEGAAAAVPADTHPDRYGEGGFVETFERRMADLLGKPAAALLPSGTMAQQIALRIHCDRRGRTTVAFHPTCHLELHEHGAYAQLHGLRAELIGDRDRLIALEDLEAIRVPIGALLIELPQRALGGRLPEWEDLLAQIQWARERDIATHLDGARIWESAPYYGRSHSEIATLFDTAYVSLYKALGGFGGSVLAGPEDVVDEARVWRHRHGGTLWNLFPFAASAQRGLDGLLPQMPRFLEHARAVASALRQVPGLTIVPDPPQTPLFHILVHADAQTVRERATRIAEERRVWLFDTLAPTVVPDVSKVELSIGEPALEIPPGEAAELFEMLTAP